MVFFLKKKSLNAPLRNLSNCLTKKSGQTMKVLELERWILASSAHKNVAILGCKVWDVMV